MCYDSVWTKVAGREHRTACTFNALEFCRRAAQDQGFSSKWADDAGNMVLELLLEGTRLAAVYTKEAWCIVVKHLLPAPHPPHFFYFLLQRSAMVRYGELLRDSGSFSFD